MLGFNLQHLPEEVTGLKTRIHKLISVPDLKYLIDMCTYLI